MIQELEKKGKVQVPKWYKRWIKDVLKPFKEDFEVEKNMKVVEEMLFNNTNKGIQMIPIDVD